MSIKEDINQYLQMSESELDKVLFMLKKKGFFDDPYENSLETFIECLKASYGWGKIAGMRESYEKMKEIEKNIQFDFDNSKE